MRQGVQVHRQKRATLTTAPLLDADWSTAQYRNSRSSSPLVAAGDVRRRDWATPPVGQDNGGVPSPRPRPVGDARRASVGQVNRDAAGSPQTVSVRLERMSCVFKLPPLGLVRRGARVSRLRVLSPQCLDTPERLRLDRASAEAAIDGAAIFVPQPTFRGGGGALPPIHPPTALTILGTVLCATVD
uniref:Uncharacterized protein n=1 Tax=Trichuris muris TaxID=70415 RepID=A0A5S6Q7V0_TRIMR